MTLFLWLFFKQGAPFLETNIAVIQAGYSAGLDNRLMFNALTLISQQIPGLILLRSSPYLSATPLTDT